MTFCSRNNSENNASSFKQGKHVKWWVYIRCDWMMDFYVWWSDTSDHPNLWPLTWTLTWLTLTLEQVRYTVALNPFVRACVGKSRAEKVVCPLHPGTQRENGSFGRPARGRKNGAQKGGPCRGGEGGEEVTVQKVTLPPSQPWILFSTHSDELQVDCTNLPSWSSSRLIWLCLE